MGKRGILVLSVFCLIVISATYFVGASRNVLNHTLEVDGISYIIELVAGENGRATIRLNGDFREIDPVQSSPPYTPERFKDLYFILKYARFLDALGIVNVTLYVGVEKSFYLNETGDDLQQNITLDQSKYKIDLLSTNVIRITNGSDYSYSKEMNKEYSPPYYGKSYPPFSDIAFVVVTGSKETNFVINTTEITFFELNFIYNESNDCSDECNLRDFSLCESSVPSFYYQTCGNYDFDSCLEWSNATRCNSGEICSNGKCIEDENYVKCNDNSDCDVKVTGSPYCEGDSVCTNFVSYICINPGTSQSYCNATTTRDCSFCPNGCQDNHCVNKSLPNPKPVEECERMGVRYKSKYCSINKTWLPQKSDKSLCENNFECKSNLCIEEQCSIIRKSFDKNLLFFISGFIAIILVFYLIFKRKNER